MRRLLCLIPALLLAACSTAYYDYSGSPVSLGKGGASRKVAGVDLWVRGTQPWKFYVIGYITDRRIGQGIAMMVRDGQLAAQVRARGGHALLMETDIQSIPGTVSTASATVTGYRSASVIGNTAYWNGTTNAFGSGMTMPILRRDSTFYVIKYVSNNAPALPSKV
jgi:hypothetical protein